MRGRGFYDFCKVEITLLKTTGIRNEPIQKGMNMSRRPSRRITGMSAQCRAIQAIVHNVRPLCIGILFAYFSCTGMAETSGESADNGEEAVEETIHIKGSDTMAVMNRRLASVYMRQNRISVEVSGGGSSRGIDAIFDSTADIAASSRSMTADEIVRFEETHGKKPIEIPVASDGIAIYVHPTNPVKYLTLDRLQRIYSADITHWKPINGFNHAIEIYVRDEFSGTHAVFIEKALEGEEFAESAKVVSTITDLQAAVTRNPGAIGFSGVADLRGSRILRLATEGVASAVGPSRENVISNRYPLSRYLYYYVNPITKTPAISRFLRWMRSRTAKETIDSAGLYPVTSSIRGRPAPK